MEGNLAKELYSFSGTLHESDVKLSVASTSYDNQGDSHDGDESDFFFDDGSPQNEVKENLDREWQCRHNQFHTIGYRDGLTAGKEASAQEGFNIGFKESVIVGYNLGVVRGVTSAMNSLPKELQEKLVEKHEKRIRLQKLCGVVRSLTSTDALKLFHDEMQTRKSVEPTENAELSSVTLDVRDLSLVGNPLRNHHEELQSILLDSPLIKVHLETNQ